MRAEITRCRTRRGARAGIALLEVIVALAVLSTAGVAAVSLAVAGEHAVNQARSADVRVRRASGFLEAVALWPREDLDRRLGDRQQGPYRLRITRAASTLYVVQLWDSAGAEMLVGTAVYRPNRVQRVAQ